jgi:hypothetical protein
MVDTKLMFGQFKCISIFVPVLNKIENTKKIMQD